MKTALIFLFALGIFVPKDPSALIGRSVPRFEASSVDSTRIDSTSFLSKVTVITFYSSHCAPCRTEINLLNELTKKFDKNDFQVLTITDDKVKKIISDFDFNNDTANIDRTKYHINKASFKVIHDIDNKIKYLFLVQPLPATFIVDQRGIIQDFLLGFPMKRNEIYDAFITEKIEKLVREK